MTEIDTLAARFATVRETMRAHYAKQHADPWIVAYSGGKDSTLLLHLTWDVLVGVHPQPNP